MNDTCICYKLVLQSGTRQAKCEVKLFGVYLKLPHNELSEAMVKT